MHLLQVKNIGKKYKNGLEIDSITFNQNAGNKIAIIGASGAGKTTILKIIAGQIQTDTGEVLFENKKIKGPLDQLLPGHASIGYLSQQYELLNNYVVADLLWFENKLSLQSAQELFDICNISHLLQRKTDKLSGGEKQRIALCMLLIKKPKLLVLDEPFSNLDLIHKITLKKVLNAVSNQLSITCLLSSHDPQDVLSWADEIIVLHNGKIVQKGIPKQVYYQPLNINVAGLLGKYNLLTVLEAYKLLDMDILLNQDKQLLIRPEQISITSSGSGIIATVLHINFLGGYLEVEVAINDTRILFFTINTELEIGSTIGLQFSTKNICWV